MDRRVETVMSFVRIDPSKRITLNEVSRMVNLSPWRLCHLFKAETGMSLINFVHMIRMSEAKNLLETTFLSIKEIRARVGATDESYFIRKFERTYHMTPSQYRVRYATPTLTEKSSGSLKLRKQQNGQGNSKII